MIAIEALRAGQLKEAQAALHQQVKSQPADPKHRVFLFQLLAVFGEWERSLVQLNLAGELDDGNLQMMHAYREALQCEVLREEVFAGKTTPVVFGEPEAWMARLIEALRQDGLGDAVRTAALRASALQDAPATAGTIDGIPFAWIADADSRLGPILEVLVNGRYYWAPFQRMQSLTIEAPTDLRDRVWMPVHIRWASGGDTVGFVPTRYAGTTKSGDDRLMLAAMTSWQEPAPGEYFGLGQRMLATDQGDYPLMDARSIVFKAPEA